MQKQPPGHGFIVIYSISVPGGRDFRSYPEPGRCRGKAIGMEHGGGASGLERL